MAADAVLRVAGVRRVFGDIIAVSQANLELRAGQFAVVLGRSGSGKSTLLSLAAGLDQPDVGTVHVDGVELSKLTAEERERVRLKSIGLVLQAPGLLDLMSAAENVALPLRASGVDRKDALEAAGDALSAVGLAPRAGHRAYELSGGEQQRVALARAMVKSPVLLVADEPTGQLDTETARSVMALMRRFADEGVATLVATHDEAFVEVADFVATIDDGRLT